MVDKYMEMAHMRILRSTIMEKFAIYKLANISNFTVYIYIYIHLLTLNDYI